MKKTIAILAIAASGISSAALAGNPSTAPVDPEVENKVPVILPAAGLGAAGTTALVVLGVAALAAVAGDDDEATSSSTTTGSN